MFISIVVVFLHQMFIMMLCVFTFLLLCCSAQLNMSNIGKAPQK